MRALLTLLALAPLALPALAAPLNDTGQTLCYDNTAPTPQAVACDAGVGGDAGTNPRQDARYGRDAANTAGALNKTGGGAAGFDFTRVCNSGELEGQGSCPANLTTPGAGANEWGCTRDNHTGLVWELKTDDNALRDKDHGYRWYNSNASTNGDNAGSTGSNTCNATLPGSLCNTEAYATALNAANICGETTDDWRLPSRGELLSLVHLGTFSPSIDAAYFPNTQGNVYWSADTYTHNHPAAAAGAWRVNFGGGGVDAEVKTGSYYVRLVRGGQ